MLELRHTQSMLLPALAGSGWSLRHQFSAISLHPHKLRSVPPGEDYLKYLPKYDLSNPKGNTAPPVALTLAQPPALVQESFPL